MNWMTYILLMASSFISHGAIPWSNEYHSVDQDSLHQIVHALQQRMSDLETVISSTSVGNKPDILERELHQMRDENKQFKIILRSQEEKMERLQRDHLDLQSTVKELVKQMRECKNKDLNPSVQTFVDIKSDSSSSRVFTSALVHDLEDEKDNDTLASVREEKSNGHSSITVSGNKTTSTRRVLGKQRQLFRRQVPPRQVAFDARLSVSEMNVVVGQAIVFDRVMTNIGGGYHVNSGMFIAPEDGIYVFHVSALSGFGKIIALVLVKNGAIFAQLNADARGTQSFDSGSITVPVEVNKGEEVWVRVHDGNAIHGNSYTTFTGWLTSSNENPTSNSN